MDPVLFLNEYTLYYAYYAGIICAASIATTIVIYINISIIKEKEQSILLKRIALSNIMWILVFQTYIPVIEFSNNRDLKFICADFRCSNIITVSAMVSSLSALLTYIHHGRFSKNNIEDINYTRCDIFGTCYVFLPLICYLLAYFVGIDIAIQRFYSLSTLIIVIYNVIRKISNTSIENLSKNENITPVVLSKGKLHCATIVLILLYLVALEMNIQEQHQLISYSFLLTTLLISTTGCIYLSLIKRMTPRSVLLQL